MTQISINGNSLKKIATSSPTAEVVVLDIALRERMRSFTDIHRNKTRLIRSGHKIVQSEYNKIWKDLQDIGAGVIIYGRKGQLDRFHWHYSMKKIAEAALEGKDLVVEKVTFKSAETPKTKAKLAAKPKSMVKAKPAKVAKPAAVKVADTSTKEVFLQIRPEFLLDFTVPKDFTKAEAEVIATALRRLAA